MSMRSGVLLLALSALLSGCGYGLVGRTSSLPEDIEDVYVQPLGNLTTRSQVDLLLTQAIGDEFVKRRRFNLISDRRGADAVLTGVVTETWTVPTTGQLRDVRVIVSYPRGGGKTAVDTVASLIAC